MKKSREANVDKNRYTAQNPTSCRTPMVRDVLAIYCAACACVVGLRDVKTDPGQRFRLVLKEYGVNTQHPLEIA